MNGHTLSILHKLPFPIFLSLFAFLISSPVQRICLNSISFEELLEFSGKYNLILVSLMSILALHFYDYKYVFLSLFFSLSILGIEPMALRVLCKHPISELHS